MARLAATWQPSPSVTVTPSILFQKASRVDDLGSLCFQTTCFTLICWCARSATKEFSSVAILGPGRTIECHNRHNQLVRDGVFQLGADSTGVGLIMDLSAMSNPPAAPGPMGGFIGPGTCVVTVTTNSPKGWNDTMESYQFI